MLTPLPPLPPDLLRTYVNTAYELALTVPVTAHIGGPDAGVAAALADQGAMRAVVITGHNPFSQPATAEQNEGQNALLSADIRNAGLSCVAARGVDPTGEWPSELGFCAFDAPDVLVDVWLVRYGQHAAVVIDADGSAELLLHPGHRATAL